MSASERLERLSYVSRRELGYALFPVVPEIIDVVKAAERMAERLETNSEAGTPDWFGDPLLALEAALTPRDGVAVEPNSFSGERETGE